MMLQMRDGDYIPGRAGGYVRLDGAEALLMRVLFRLQCRRGALPMLPALPCCPIHFCRHWSMKH